MKPFLSVIVPVYKVENFLTQCVDSILGQTFSDFELILVDDGSPDKCPDMCDEYARADSRVRVIHQKNGGLVSARKAGIAACQGEYVAVVDSDDWIEATMFEKMVTAAQEKNADMVLCDYVAEEVGKSYLKTHGIFEGDFSKKELEETVYPKMLYTGEYYIFGMMPALGNKLIRRAILEKALAQVDPTISLGEDVATGIPCFLMANSLSILPNHPMLYHYRIHGNSMCRTYKKKVFEANHVLFCYLAEVFSQTNYASVLMPQLNYYVTYMTLEAIDNEFLTGNPLSAWQKYRKIKMEMRKAELYNVISYIPLSDMTGGEKMRLWFLQKKWYLVMTMLLQINQTLKKH